MALLITSRLKQHIDSLPGYLVCKDEQSTYLYSNQRNAALIGFRYQEEAVGMTDLDMPCGAVESAHLFRAQDREVIRTGQPLHTLDIHCYADNKWRTIFGCKEPLRDEENNIVGTIAHGQEVNTGWLLKLGMLLGKIANCSKGELDVLASRTSYIIGSPGHGPKLSQRQEEILFLLLRGKSARLIGKALGIATRTVEWHVCTLKEKFAVLSKCELIDKASEQGYLHNLPPGLCKRELSLVLREE
ncbi:helix-turn-helix transcriptional regulator [Paludibacterium purpuratum]|uniref:Regulatory LuxR family protein n=1 Tax=Paludibacterium purpuratum TaxID=1144873 RepID=A0A4R7BAJ2_9NEIS|nr:helix-turn-helix transcriptional regulator [Paludibacterium purpuratum]TDR81898.1 regulatory LuxR family protein [Paludibacterium purpuratum]